MRLIVEVDDVSALQAAERIVTSIDMVAVRCRFFGQFAGAGLAGGDIAQIRLALAVIERHHPGIDAVVNEMPVVRRILAVVVENIGGRAHP